MIRPRCLMADAAPDDPTARSPHVPLSATDATHQAALMGQPAPSATAPEPATGHDARTVHQTADTQPRSPAACPTFLLPGYEIIGELGRGGMGVVFKARQVQLNRLVALKMILAGEFARPIDRERFRTEAVRLARVQHPNIVQIFDVGEYANRPYFAMEFVGGGTLT